MAVNSKGKTLVTDKKGQTFTLKQLANRCKDNFTREETTGILKLLLKDIDKDKYESSKEQVEIFLGIKLEGDRS